MPGSPTKNLNREKEILKAVKSGSVGSLRQLLARDASLVRVRDKDGSTPLHWAAWKGHREVARLLLDAGAEVNARNKNRHWGTTPLHAAAHGNQVDVAKLLLARGAKINAKNLHSRTPLGETTFHKATAVAALLRENGARD